MKKKKQRFLTKFDRKTKAVSGGIVRTVDRVRKSVKRFDRNLSRIGNAIERLYDAQSKAGL